MSDTWKTVSAQQVTPGDTVRARGEIVLTVTRVEDPFLGRAGMLAFIEDTNERWLKVPVPADADVEVLVLPGV